MNALPPERQVLAGRTHSRAWDAAEAGAAITVFARRGRLPVRAWDTPEVGAAVQRFRARRAAIDIACWVLSGVLLIGSAALAWWR